MRKAIGIALCALALGGCSQTALDAGFKNLTSVQCDNQQAALANIPLMFVTPAQAAQILAGICTTFYGTSPAPTTAPGQTPVIK